jgi:hypothetical protein
LVQNILSSLFLSKNIKIKIYGTVNYPVFLCGCETSYFALSEVRRLKVFKNRVPVKVFGHERQDVTGDQRKLRNEELHDFFSSPNIIWVFTSRRVRWMGHVVCMRENRNAYWVFMTNLNE